jgi:cyclopropane-fatty-acyl-phospholipid synthase
MSQTVRGASPAAIRHHYDVGNDFYRLWLDDGMTYSCALYDWDDPNDDLERAQIRKIDFHVAEAEAAGAERVLDVGCGWGSVLDRLVRVHGVGRAVGLTLSDEQAAWHAAARDPRVEVRVEGWESHEPDAPYDAVVSIGAMEHFAKPAMTIKEKIDSYRSFLLRCHGFTRPGAFLSLQFCGYGWLRREDLDTSFVAHEIFPESEFVHLAELARACEGIFEIVHLRNDRRDYERTCREWLERMRARRDAVVAASSEVTVEKWERYLEMCIRGWQTAATLLFRVKLRRLDHPRL